MSLPPGFTDGLQAESHGIGVNLIPGDARFQIELQRAPDNGSGAPGTFATIQQLPPIPAASTFVDLLADDGAFRHYRARHIGPGYGPSTNWSPVGRGKPVRLEGGAAAGGLISLYPLVRDRPMSDGDWAVSSATSDGKQVIKEGKIEGQTRTLAQVVTYLVPNAEFDIWESASQPHAWSVDTGDSSVAEKETSLVFSGDAAAKYSFGGGGSAGTYRGLTSNDLTKGTFCVPLRPGVPYTLKVASRVSAIGTNQAYRITINHNAARTLQSIKTIAYRAATTYQVDEFTFVTPATAEANAELKIEFTRGSTSATDFWVDSLRIDELEVKELFDNGTVSAAFTIDWANGQRQKVTLAASSLACTFLNAMPGAKNTLLLAQDITGTRLLPVFDGIVMWANNGVAPTLSTAPGVTDELEFVAQTLPTLRYYAKAPALNYLPPTPTVPVTPGNVSFVAATSHPATMPTGIVAGDLLLIIMCNDSAQTPTNPGGWTLIAQGTLSGGTVTLSVWGKIAAGGDTFTSTTGAASTSCLQAYRINTWFGSLAGVTLNGIATGSSTTPDPPSLTAGWTDRSLWLAIEGLAGSPGLTGTPANYTNPQDTNPGGGTCELRTARRQFFATTENPGTFTISPSGAWGTFTFAVRPPA
jgi:hypothetical protein